MSEEKRTIKINPDLFKVSGKTRKNQPRNTEGKDIRVKSANAHNKTTKGKVLRYIREQQEKNYRKLFEENKPGSSVTTMNMKNTNPFPDTSSEFENSINYLKSIEENNKLKISSQNHNPQNHNHTIKHRPIEQNLYNTHPNTSFLNADLPAFSMINETMTLTPKPPAYPPPQYGCLKNGNLPTYRTMMRQTAKAGGGGTNNIGASFAPTNNNIGASFAPMNSVYPPSTVAPSTNNISAPSMNSVYPPSTVATSTNSVYSGPPAMNAVAYPSSVMEDDYSAYTLKEKLKKEQIRKIMEKNKLNEKMNELKQMPKLKGFKQKQKKTIRRTYHTGKSKVFSKVGVLVSNRTIRNNITTQMHKLKEIPMQDIRKFLIQKGLIKVGSTAPNDVLRQMYENSVLIGGELINHNTENLLYNYLNEDASSKTTGL